MKTDGFTFIYLRFFAIQWLLLYFFFIILYKKIKLVHTYTRTSRERLIERKGRPILADRPISTSALSHQARLRLNKHSDVIGTFASHDILARDGTSVAPEFSSQNDSLIAGLFCIEMICTGIDERWLSTLLTGFVVLLSGLAHARADFFIRA